MLWSTVSKAFFKSRKVRLVFSLLLWRFDLISSIKVAIALLCSSRAWSQIVNLREFQKRLGSFEIDQI